MGFEGYEGPDQVFGRMLPALYDLTVEYSKLSAELAAADGDRKTALEEFMKSSDMPAVQKLRQQIDSAKAKLLELAEKNVSDVQLSEEDREKRRVEMDELKKKIRAGHDAISNGVKVLGQDVEGITKALEEIGDPTKSGRGRKAGTPGSSLPRVSATVTVTGGNLENEVYDSFSKVAMALDVEVKDLQVAFAEAAGVKHEDIKTVTESVTFEFTPPHPNASKYTLTTTPKARAKPGPRAKTETASVESNSEAA
jgi:hypothetical protein